MQSLWQDLRYGARMLAKKPGFTLIAVLTLALGIGANATIFTWLKAVALNPIPGAADASRLMIFEGEGGASVSYSDYRDFRERATTLAGLVCGDLQALRLGAKDEPERVTGMIVSGNYFDVLGVKMAFGRGFLPEEDQTPGAHQVVVISHELWRRSFGGDPGVIGRTVTLNKMPFTVVGVAAPEFNGTMTGLVTEAWVPMMMYERIRPGLSRVMFEHRGNHWLDGIARIKPGVSPAQARAELETISAQLAREYPDTNKDKILRLQSLSRLGAGQFLTPVLSIVMALVGVLLLIVCANVANLLLARAAGRRKEISVRLAIGAGRARIVRQLLTESLLLALAGGTCGFLVALWSAGLLKAVFPPVDGKLIDLAPDAQVLGFTFLLSLVTTVVFGLVPALQSSRLDLVSTLKEETAGGARRRGRLRGSLVVAQVAMALLLLLCAGLFMRGVQKAQSVNPGFNSQNVLLASVDLFPNGYSEESGANFFRQALARLAAIPGAQSVSLARRIPLGIEGVSDRSLEIEGYQPPKGEEAWAFYNSVGPDYFRTLEVPLVSGREFTAHDGRDAMKVAVVNQTFVNRYLPNQNAVGRRIRDGADWITIIGVARDFKYKQLDERPSPYLFQPVYQAHRPDMTFLVRTSGAPMTLRSSVQETLRSIDPSLPVFAIRTLEASAGAALIAQRTGSMLLGLFGIVALFLSATGLYGVLAYSVSERRREIGIRIALGASAGDMLKLVIGQGVKLIMLGTAVGLLAALGVTRLLASLIFGVSPTDPLTFVGVTVLLVIFALLACYLPARRAAKVDPMVALRCE
jgi:predicted permease